MVTRKFSWPRESRLVVPSGTIVVKVMARAKMSKRRQESGGETAVSRRILEAAFAAFMKSGYAAASMLEIATRARVSKRELYALVGNKQEILIACFSERAKRLDLPGNLPVPRDRETLAKVLASFGTKLVREVSDPTVVAVFRLAIAEAAQAPPSGACPRFYRTRGKPRGLAAKSWPRLRRPGAHRPSCRTCRAVRRTAL